MFVSRTGPLRCHFSTGFDDGGGCSEPVGHCHLPRGYQPGRLPSHQQEGGGDRCCSGNNRFSLASGNVRQPIAITHSTRTPSTPPTRRWWW